MLNIVISDNDMDNYLCRKIFEKSVLQCLAFCPTRLAKTPFTLHRKRQQKATLRTIVA